MPQEDVNASEQKWLEFWEKEKIYEFDQNSKKPAYSIDTPPPTVSGKMHMGHACSYSQQDFIARYKRMKGYNIFYPFGTDDNGLPTERLIEKTKNVKLREMPRDEFVKLCVATLEKELRPKYVYDWKRIGISCDWKIFYSTIDDHSRKISQWSFLDLYKKGRMERRDAPSMWCPECQTGIAQIELQDKEQESTFNHIKFQAEGKDLIIATTRPELLPACVAIFYHPTDKRYTKLKGKKAKVPLFNFEVPILEDERADPEKGTGIVMCCTFGDQTDMEWQKAHQLTIKEAITRDGRMTEISGKYKGLNVKQARKQILTDLETEKLLVKKEPIKHFVNVHERCGTEIEIIKSKQWFVKYLDLKEKMLEWGAELKWHPPHMKHRYDNWVKGLQWDWLVSNQRYFGVPFPVWYCEKCNQTIFAEEKELPVDPLQAKKNCPKCKKEATPEKDVLNTWFTSSMTPQIATQLMPEKIRNKIFPMSLRPQAHEIISFWLFNTVVKSQMHYGKNPFKEVAISGFVTLGGEKMSKSKGNVVEPQTITEKYGADTLRYWAAGSKLGEDRDYMEKDVITGQKTTTKLKNACKFAFMHLQDFNKETPKELELYDKAIISNFNKIIKECTEHFEEYEYSKTKQEIDNFFWHSLCDNYLEIVKDRLYNPDKRGIQQRKSAQHTLYYLLFNVLKMFAPIMPFITEELYQEHFKKYEKEKSIHLTTWPEYADEPINEDMQKIFSIMHKTVEETRKHKSQKGISLKEPVKKITIKTQITQKQFDLIKEDLLAATHAKEINYQKSEKDEIIIE